MVGAVVGGLKFKKAETMLTMIDNRSGVQIGVAQGNATKTDFEKEWSDVTAGLVGPSSDGAAETPAWSPPPPEYRRPDKNWRLKRGATPQWYKARQGVRRQVQSGAARVARYRPRRPGA